MGILFILLCVFLSFMKPFLGVGECVGHKPILTILAHVPSLPAQETPQRLVTVRSNVSLLATSPAHLRQGTLGSNVTLLEQIGKKV